jgi:CelD/BcsL family acetyltransferase involved in cellulose biosynthesis
VHAVSGDVRVVVAETGGAITALLPLQRPGAGPARPVGWPAADFQGPILAAGTTVDPAALVAASGARSFAFDHLLDEPAGFAPYVEVRRPSPYLEVTGGLEGYLGRAGKSGRDNMGQARRRANKAGRELGPVRFEPCSTDPAVLDQVIELKRGQYRATGAKDYFAGPGRRELLHHLLGIKDPEFGGILSTVRAGDRLLAAHFGLRSGPVLHWWFPVYDPELGGYAPGWILLRELTQAAPDLGFARIDLGRGEDEYKRRAMTGETLVCTGLVTTGSVRRELRRARVATETAVRSSPLMPVLRGAVRRLRQR